MVGDGGEVFCQRLTGLDMWRWLVKNIAVVGAFDAIFNDDAHGIVSQEGREDLADPERLRVVLVENGIGMEGETCTRGDVLDGQEFFQLLFDLRHSCYRDGSTLHETRAIKGFIHSHFVQRDAVPPVKLYGFDSWDREGEVFETELIWAECERDAVSVFLGRFPDRGFDSPFTND